MPWSRWQPQLLPVPSRPRCRSCFCLGRELPGSRWQEHAGGARWPTEPVGRADRLRDRFRALDADVVAAQLESSQGAAGSHSCCQCLRALVADLVVVEVESCQGAADSNADRERPRALVADLLPSPMSFPPSLSVANEPLTRSRRATTRPRASPSAMRQPELLRLSSVTGAGAAAPTACSWRAQKETVHPRPAPSWPP